MVVFAFRVEVLGWISEAWLLRVFWLRPGGVLVLGAVLVWPWCVWYWFFGDSSLGVTLFGVDVFTGLSLEFWGVWVVWLLIPSGPLVCNPVPIEDVGVPLLVLLSVGV